MEGRWRVGGGVGWRGSRGLMGRTTGGVQHPREERRPDHTPRLVTPEGVGGLLNPSHFTQTYALAVFGHTF